MKRLLLAHHNNCPRCPVLGAEDIPGEEYFEILSLRFSIRVAKEMARRLEPVRIEPDALQRWLSNVRIDEHHVGHVPAGTGHGVMVTLPSGCGQPLIDGNHRAARSLRDGSEFRAVILSERQTLELLRRSMTPQIADHVWRLLEQSKPHPLDARDE